MYVDSFTPSGLDVYPTIFAPDGTYRDPGTPGPVPGPRVGEYFKGYFAGFPDATCETVGLDAISERVWVWRWVVRGTNSGPFSGLPPTGRTLTLPGVEIIETAGDKIRHVDGYFDRLTLMEQLGRAPAPAAHAAT
jgi:hypothetical protein